MASKDTKDGKGTPSDLTSKVNPTEVANDELDLDKNPIKFATADKGVYDMEPHDKAYMELVYRSGKHSDLVKKILRQRIETRAKDFPRWPGCPNGGVRSVWIESRFWYDRERLSPDFDSDWRRYRARYIHSLELDPREPVHVPQYEQELINPIRRFYMRGGDFFEKYFISWWAKDKMWSQTCRWVAVKVTFGFILANGLYYYLRYNDRKWYAEKGGAILMISRPLVNMGDPRFPYKDPHTEDAHYFHQQFPHRTIYKDLRDYDDITDVQ